MKAPTPEQMDSTVEQIAEMHTWANYNGWTAVSCGQCKKTVNVLSYAAGWFCPCGAYNNQSWTQTFIPHETPDYGPSLAVIAEGHRQGKLGREEAFKKHREDLYS